MSTSPYQSPGSPDGSSSPPEAPLHLVTPPAAIKVFGILHLVVASFGLLCNVVGALSTMFMGEFVNFAKASVPTPESTSLDGMAAYMNEVAWLMWIQVISSIVLVVMLFIAGIRLLKVRDSGRRMSNFYAVTSILLKVVICALTIIFISPIAERWYETMPNLRNSAAGLELAKKMNGASQILSSLATCIYPIVVLILLNGQKVKDFLRNR